MNIFRAIADLFQRSKNDLTKRIKAPILRELDRAIQKAKNGESGAQVVIALKFALVKILSQKLPEGFGDFLLETLLANVNWDELTKFDPQKLADFLLHLKKQVEGFRL